MGGWGDRILFGNGLSARRPRARWPAYSFSFSFFGFRFQEVPFGFIIPSPTGGPDSPLAVVQPQDGEQRVACASSRYEFELFSGTVLRISSQAQAAAGGMMAPLRAIAAALRLPLDPVIAAVHELEVGSFEMDLAGNDRRANACHIS